MFYLFFHSCVFFLLGEQAIRHILPSCSRKAHHQDRVSVLIDVLACFLIKGKKVSGSCIRSIIRRVIYGYIKQMA